MEDFCKEEFVTPLFKISDLAHMYKVHLEQLGADIEGGSHITRLKIRMLSVLPYLMGHLQGRDALCTFIDDIGDALKKAYDHDGDVMHLA